MNILTDNQNYLWRRMFIPVLFLIPLLTLSAQEINLDKKIQLTAKTLTLNQLLDELHKTYKISFSYNNKALPMEKTIEFNTTNVSLKTILVKIEKEAGITYKLLNDVIILKSIKSDKTCIINGYIEDKSSGEKLIGGNIYNTANQTGTTTNTYGFFSVTYPEGIINLAASYVGYKRFEQSINLTSDTTINIKLEPSISLEEVIIEGNRKEYSTLSKLSVMKVSSKEVNKIPALLGEVDLLKSLQLLPGVQSGMEGSSGLVVRGGGTDQNLIILDGVPVYNVNHLFGFFSVFNSSSIKDVSLYKSGFPARYGGRASSVIDINMKEGNNKKLQGEGSIGLIASKFTMEGPIKNENTSFIISGRRTYLDILAKPWLTTKEEGRTTKLGYYFYDLNMKINHKFSDKSRLYLSSYLGNDVFSNKWETTEERDELNTLDELKWGNITTNLRWNYMLGNKLFMNSTVSYSTYRFLLSEERETIEYEDDVKEETSYSGKFLNGIYDISTKVDFDYFPNPNHIIKFGAGYYNHTFVPSSFEEFKDPGKDTSRVEKLYGNESFLYFEDNITIGRKLTVNAGAHISNFNTGKKNYSHLQPRISIKYTPWSSLAIKGSYSKMVQYLQTNSYSSISLPIDLWVPSTDSLKPILSDNYAFGLDYKLRNNCSFGVEGFYKNLENVSAFKEGSFPNPGFLADIVQGKGWSYGVEFIVRKNSGNTTGWLAYTWSHSWRKFEGISFNQKFPDKYDRRHDISLVAIHKFNNRIDIGGSWVYGTGNAMSLSTEKYISNFALEAYGEFEVGKPHIQKYETRNNFRMPNYHRMDVGINFHKQKKRHTRTWSFGAYNVYNRRNPFWIHWDDSEQYTDKEGLYQVSLFQIIPYFKYSFKF